MSSPSPSLLRQPSRPLARLPRFLLAGGLATALHWTTMATAIAAGLAAWPATVLGATAGALFNYPLQRRMVFASRQTHRRLVGPYALAVLAAWLANGLLFLLLQTVAELSSAPAQVLTSAIVAGLQYAMLQRGVFR